MSVCLACSHPNPDTAAYCAICGATLPRPGSGSTLPGSPLDAAVAPAALPPPAAQPRRLAIGDIVDGKYRLDSILGEGGMGIVYLARDLNTDTNVVVKAIRGELAHEPGLRERVRAEGRALAHIDHPNVVRLNAIVAERNDLFLVMQYVEGQSLDKLIETHIKSRTPLPADRVLHLFRQIVAGVGAAHREGVVHRDIKPGNVLIRAKDGVAKVTDFGIAKPEEDAKAGRGQTRGIIGSLWYMAPEQVTGRRDIDKRVDVYALGIVLYEMLVGSVPFDAPGDYDIMRMHVEAPLPSVALARPDAPPWIDALLARACAKDRDQRFSSCEELLAAMDQMERSVPRPPAPSPDTTEKRGPVSLAVRPVEAEIRASALPPLTTSQDREAPGVTATQNDPPPKKRWPWVVGGATLISLVGAGAWVVGFSGLLDDPAPQPRKRAPPIVLSAAHSGTRPPASASADARPPGRLASLQGKWVSDSKRHYSAVLLGDSLDFRVVDPAEHPGQNYEVDEPRFSLSEVAGQAWFAVEDRIRPIGPPGKPFAPLSRASCQTIWKAVDGEPLRAYSENNTRLRVDLTKITPALSHFKVEQGRVVSCDRLNTAQADRIESTLTRE